MSLISAQTRIYGVVGDPIVHSLSPRIHNNWIQAQGLDAAYIALHLTGADAEQTFRAMANTSIGGLNVTLPHKIAALQAADEVGAEARTLGAANTLSLRDTGGWRADNTDAEGFDACLDSLLQQGALPSREALLIGAGGAARAAAWCLGRSGYNLTIANRTLARAQALAQDLAPQAKVCGLDALSEQMQTAGLVVHATSLGYGSGSDIVFPDRADTGAIMLDLSYGEAARPLLQNASARGWRVSDGLVMLAAQAAASYRLWFGVTPDIDKALELCREAII